MAITIANLTSGSSTVDASSWPTLSVAPTANKLVLVTVTSSHTAGATIPTVTGNGLAYVQIGTQANTVGLRRTTMFRAMGAAPTAGALTIDFGGVTQTGAAWSVDEASDIDTTGTNGSGAVVQSVGATADPVSSLTITLATFESVNNAAFGTFFTGQDMTSGSGFTMLSEPSYTLPFVNQHTEWKINDNTVDVSNTDLSSGTINGFAIEIRAYAAPPAGQSFSKAISNLSPGNHTITVKATDNEGLVSSQSIAVYSQPPTTFYLPSSGASPVVPYTGSSWSYTTGADYLRMVTAPSKTPMATKTSTKLTTYTGSISYLSRAYVSDPLEAQTITGYVKGYLRAKVSAASSGQRLYVILGQVNQAGTISYNEIYLSSGSTENLYDAAKLVNRRMPQSLALPYGQAINFTTNDGDRLVLYVGSFSAGNANAYTIEHRFGDSAGSDLLENETDALDYNPWVEFTHEIKFKTTVGQKFNVTGGGSINAIAGRRATANVTGGGSMNFVPIRGVFSSFAVKGGGNITANTFGIRAGKALRMPKRDPDTGVPLAANALQLVGSTSRHILLGPPSVGYNFDNLINKVIALGAKPARGIKRLRVPRTAKRNHPLSPWKLSRNGTPQYRTLIIETGAEARTKTRHSGTTKTGDGKKRKEWEVPLHESVVKRRAQLEKVADRALAEGLRAHQEVSLECLPQPHLELGDMCAVETEHDGRIEFRLKAYTLPLTSDGAMSINFNRAPRLLPKRRRKSGHGRKR